MNVYNVVVSENGGSLASKEARGATNLEVMAAWHGKQALLHYPKRRPSVVRLGLACCYHRNNTESDANDTHCALQESKQLRDFFFSKMADDATMRSSYVLSALFSQDQTILFEIRISLLGNTDVYSSLRILHLLQTCFLRYDDCKLFIAYLLSRSHLQPFYEKPLFNRSMFIFRLILWTPATNYQT